MTKGNPYKNPLDNVLNGLQCAHGNPNTFLDIKIKDKELCQLIKDIVEVKCHHAFNDGREQGKFETGQALKEIIEFPDPEFENHDNGEY
jgi:hypothetical protein